MSSFQMILAGAGPTVDDGAAISGVIVVTLVVVAILGAVVWGYIRLRSVQPVLRKGVSSIREERFASEVLRGFLPDGKHTGASTRGAAPEPAPRPESGSKDRPLPADEVEGGGAVGGGAPGDMQDFYANALTSKPVRAAGPTTVTLTYGTSRPEVSGAFGEAVRELVEGIRGLATAVEQAALVGGGSELDRAARSVEAFTGGLGALPVNEILVSAAKAVAARPSQTGAHGSA
jgi:hypothetical protein